MNPNEFVNYCRSELKLSFQNSKAGKTDEKQKFRTEGLLQALKLLGLMSAKELNIMIEDEHLEVFGESVAERKKRRAPLNELKETDPDAYFEIPAIERQKL